MYIINSYPIFKGLPSRLRSVHLTTSLTNYDTRHHPNDRSDEGNPYVAIPAAIWGLGGNEVFYNWRDNVVIPNIHTDYFGDMSNHPFK